MRYRTLMRTKHIFVIWRCIGIKGEVPCEREKPPPPPKKKKQQQKKNNNKKTPKQQQKTKQNKQTKQINNNKKQQQNNSPTKKPQPKTGLSPLSPPLPPHTYFSIDGGSSVAVLCLCFGGLLCGVCFVISCSSLSLSLGKVVLSDYDITWVSSLICFLFCKDICMSIRRH